MSVWWSVPALDGLGWQSFGALERTFSINIWMGASLSTEKDRFGEEQDLSHMMVSEEGPSQCTSSCFDLSSGSLLIIETLETVFFFIILNFKMPHYIHRSKGRLLSFTTSLSETSQRMSHPKSTTVGFDECHYCTSDTIMCAAYELHQVCLQAKTQQTTSTRACACCRPQSGRSFECEVAYCTSYGPECTTRWNAKA